MWGGKPANSRFTPVIVSVIAAVPLAFVAIAIANNEHVPNVLRWIIFSRIVVGLHAMSDVSGFGNALSRFFWVAFTVNFSYYLALIFALLMLRSLPPPR